MIVFSLSRLEKENIRLEGTEPAEFIALAEGDAFRVTSGVSYTLDVSRVSGGALVSGEVETEISGEWDRDPAFQEAVSKLEKGIYIFGHSHIQWSYQARDAGVYLINPGSCGLPLDGIRDSVPYTVLEITGAGQVNIEEKRIPFDKSAYIRAVMETGLYREANIWCRVIMRELAAAREHVHFFLKFVEQYAEDIRDDRRPYALETWEKAYEIWKQDVKLTGPAPE